MSNYRSIFFDKFIYMLYILIFLLKMLMKHYFLKV